MKDFLSALGLPASAIVIAFGLYGIAKGYEDAASKPALKYVSDLLMSRSMTSFGKVMTSLVPALFDRIFGTKPISYKFISRSILATTILWIILLSIRNPKPYSWQLGT